jgi:hypothetical protein
MSDLSPKERAITIMTDHDLDMEIARSIEQAIIAAVEQDRTDRECCKGAAKQERLAWRTICAKEVKRMLQVAEYCKEMGDPETSKRHYLAAAMVERLPERRQTRAPF